MFASGDSVHMSALSPQYSVGSPLAHLQREHSSIGAAEPDTQTRSSLRFPAESSGPNRYAFRTVQAWYSFDQPV